MKAQARTSASATLERPYGAYKKPVTEAFGTPVIV